ncbi:hypothetical protein HID58_078740, partial [Brassica napus]
GTKALTKTNRFWAVSPKEKTVAEGNQQVTTTCSIARPSMDTRQAGSQLASAEESLTRSSLRPDPNRSPDRRFEKKDNRLQSTLQSLIFLGPSKGEEEAIRDNRRETIESRRCRKRQSNITGKISVISRCQTPWEFDAESKAGRLSPEEKG